MSEYLTQAIDSLMMEIVEVAAELKADPRLERIKKLHASLNGLEDAAGRPRTSIGTFLQFDATENAIEDSTVTRPDEFYGLDPLEAAKRLLKKRGKATTLNDVMAGIRRGGGDPGNEHKLRVSLARSTMEIAKVGEDLFGLLEWYPHVKRGTPGRRKKEDSGTNGTAPDGAPEADEGPEPDEGTETGS
jgi:hypothetical protein